MSVIREHARGYKTPDPISAVLGSQQYAENYAPKGLTAAVLGAHTTDALKVSRYYMMTEPKIVVDFEPSPLDGLFYVDEKRAFFMAQGIVYIPVFLKERLTPAQFELRFAEARAAVAGTSGDRATRLALDKVPLDEAMEDPEIVAYIDRESMRRVADQMSAGKNWRGAAKTNVIIRTKKAVAAEVRERLIKHGGLGPDIRASFTTVAAG